MLFESLSSGLLSVVIFFQRRIIALLFNRLIFPAVLLLYFDALFLFSFAEH